MVLDPKHTRQIRIDAVGGPVDLSGRTIGVSMPCPGCRYDLRGVPATSHCPECGLDITQVLASAVDPTVHRLPPLASPRAVGDGIVLTSLALASGVVLPVVGVLWAGAATVSGQMGVSTPVMESLTTLAAVLVATTGLAGCWSLKPRGAGPLQQVARRAVVLCATGCLLMVGGLVSVLIEGSWFMIGGLLAAGGGLMTSLAGLRAVLLEAGRRCRAFRTATFQRQRITPLLLATALASLALPASRVADMAGQQTIVLTLGAIGLIAASMLAVGLIYLVNNAIWIRRALRQPPPRLTELLD
ncbi:MAG: hypothetical protein MK101_00925 [Phycisphaerales bacterium]|nr:hypothetical protein [Phycisphaerales bacterium]